MATAAETKKTRGPKLDAHQVLIRPLITEKGTHQSTNDKLRAYAFQVNLWANKDQIRLAVEDLFNVRVQGVRTQMHKGKKRRYRNRFGRLAHWKKAVVKLHPEDRIEFF